MDQKFLQLDFQNRSFLSKINENRIFDLKEMQKTQEANSNQIEQILSENEILKNKNRILYEAFS